MTHYVHLYSGNQAGAGLGEIEVYTGPIHHYRQRGRGIGSFFGNAYRFLRPLLSSGVNALKSQSIDSTGAIFRQLGRKDLKTILEEEGERALRNLGEKALNKLKRSVGKSDQTGKGIFRLPPRLSKMQLKRLSTVLPSHLIRRKKAIKSKKVSKKSHSVRKRRVGSVKTHQIGSGHRKRKSKLKIRRSIKTSQIGNGKRKRKTIKNRITKKRRINQLDIFN